MILLNLFITHGIFKKYVHKQGKSVIMKILHPSICVG